MPDLPQQFLYHFDEYLEGERAYSASTVASYNFDLTRFANFTDKPLLERGCDDIRKYIVSRLDAGKNPLSVRRELAAIKSFYEFLVLEGHLRRNPASVIPGPKAYRKVVRPVVTSEADAMLASIDTSTPEGLRNYALVHVVYGSGLRVSEAMRLQISDLNWTESTVKIRQGKGKKDRLAPMNNAEMEALSSWLINGRPKVVRETDTGHVFLGWRSAGWGKKLTRQRLWQILTEISEKTLGRKTSPHKFRHGFVTGLINGGADIRAVQHMAGHACIVSTMRYFHASFERIQAAYTKSHPRGVLSCEKKSSATSTACELEPTALTASSHTARILPSYPDSLDMIRMRRV